MSKSEELILTPKEAEFLALFRAMNEADQAHMLELAKGFSKGSLSLDEFRSMINRQNQ